MSFKFFFHPVKKCKNVDLSSSFFAELRFGLAQARKLILFKDKKNNNVFNHKTLPGTDQIPSFIECHDSLLGSGSDPEIPMNSDPIRIPEGRGRSNSCADAFLCLSAHQDEFQVDLNKENKFRTKKYDLKQRE